LLSSLFREAQFAFNHTRSIHDAGRLLAHTAYFHVANKGVVADWSVPLSISVSIGSDVRPLTLRTGTIGDLFILYEVLAFQAYHIPAHLIPPDKVETIIDCGANIGVTSLYFASVYPKATIYSVEADPENFALLRRNTASEPRIHPIHACIVSTPQSSVSFNNRGPAWGRKLGNDGIAVPGITLDALFSAHAINRVDLLKMDIEGAEREVLAAGDYLGHVQHVIVELHDRYGFSDFNSAMRPHGLRARRPDSECLAITAHR
jgi:FkbM family methyltransferase